MKTRSFTVILHKEDDMFIAECPEVGTVDQGKTMAEAIAIGDGALLRSRASNDPSFAEAVFRAFLASIKGHNLQLL